MGSNSSRFAIVVSMLIVPITELGHALAGNRLMGSYSLATYPETAKPIKPTIREIIPSQNE
jgi:hypothetical protein